MVGLLIIYLLMFTSCLQRVDIPKERCPDPVLVGRFYTIRDLNMLETAHPNCRRVYSVKHCAVQIVKVEDGGYNCICGVR